MCQHTDEMVAKLAATLRRLRWRAHVGDVLKTRYARRLARRAKRLEAALPHGYAERAKTHPAYIDKKLCTQLKDPRP